MRIKTTKQNLRILFDAAAKRAGSQRALADIYDVSSRTIYDWKNGKFLLPKKIFQDLVHLSRLKRKFRTITVAERWNQKRIASLGGLARVAIYGPPGTPEGRRQGGKNAIKKHQSQSETKFKTLKQISIPKKGQLLAELLGILFGDGHLSLYQVVVTTNSKTDFEHASFIKETIDRLFSITSKITKRKRKNVLVVIASSKRLVTFLENLGMPIGNKIQNGLCVPRWIRAKKKFKMAFIRGLFDTDGCIYLDRHVIKQSRYNNLGWTITSYADTLVADILDILKSLGYSPTYRPSQRSVYLRKKADIEKYFREIGTSNIKHRNRYNVMLGRVPKRS